MPQPQKPKAAYVANGWYLEIPGLISPRFETLSGLKRGTGDVEVVDAGTNIVYKFSDQILNFGTINLSRNLDGSVDDVNMEALVTACLTQGLKFSGVLIKKHFGSVVFSIGFEGIRISEEAYTDFGIDSKEKLMTNFVASVDTWLKV